MTTLGLPAIRRRHLERAGAAAALLAAVVVVWVTVNWLLGAPEADWITFCACTAYTIVWFWTAKWAIDKATEGDELPACLARVARPHIAPAGGQLVNVASMCTDCQLKTGANGPLRYCPPLEAMRAARTGARS